MWEFKNKNDKWVPILKESQQKYLTREYNKRMPSATIDLWKVDFKKNTMHDLKTKNTYDVRYNKNKTVRTNRIIPTRALNKKRIVPKGRVRVTHVPTRPVRVSNRRTRVPVSNRRTRVPVSNRRTRVPVSNKNNAQNDVVNTKSRQHVTFAADVPNNGISLSNYMKGYNHNLNLQTYTVSPTLTRTPTLTLTPKLKPQNLYSDINMNRSHTRTTRDANPHNVTLPVLSYNDINNLQHILSQNTLDSIIYALNEFFSFNISTEILHKLTPKPFTKDNMIAIFKHCAYCCMYMDNLFPNPIGILQTPLVNTHNKFVVLTQEQCCCLLSLRFLI